jgi:hypothetical protein
VEREPHYRWYRSEEFKLVRMEPETLGAMEERPTEPPVRIRHSIYEVSPNLERHLNAMDFNPPPLPEYPEMPSIPQAYSHTGAFNRGDRGVAPKVAKENKSGICLWSVAGQCGHLRDGVVVSCTNKKHVDADHPLLGQLKYDDAVACVKNQKFLSEKVKKAFTASIEKCRDRFE